MDEEKSWKQYTIAGLNSKSNKWYREGKFRDVESAKSYFKHHRKDFKNYSQLRIQSRTITKWEDEEEVFWLDEQ